MTEAEVRQRVQKLIAIHDKHPNTAEGKNALRHAIRLIEKYELDKPKMTSQPTPLAGLASAFKDLFNKEPKPVDLGELQRRLTKLLERK